MIQIASEGIGCGEPSVRPRRSRIADARLLQPYDRLFNVRLQQMHLANHEITVEHVGIAGAKADRLLF
jgi:hypothetical protein